MYRCSAPLLNKTRVRPSTISSTTLLGLGLGLGIGIGLGLG